MPIDHAAALAAGYGPEDVPMEPKRSAYTDDNAGTLAYGRALGRWVAYQTLQTPAPTTVKYRAQVSKVSDPDQWVDLGLYGDRDVAEAAARSAHERYGTTWRVISTRQPYIEPDPTPPRGTVRRNPFHIGEGTCSNPDHEGLACQ